MPELAELSISKNISYFPRTRYQGSKRKLLPWIWDNISFLDFETVLDPFGGTGSVSYLFKSKNKSVTYNDILKANYFTGVSLIENGSVLIEDSDLARLLSPNDEIDNFITDNFRDIYYYDEENQLLDRIISNLYKHYGDVKYKKAILLWIIFQACLIKRPFNLFHRKNLNMRSRTVKRSFGNKVTWDGTFESYINKFKLEVNNAIFDNTKNCVANNCPVVELSPFYDLVYIDPPYLSAKGIGVDYHQFYHFLEGLCNYNDWESLIDNSKRHKPLLQKPSPWNDKYQIGKAFREVINKFQKSHLVISYRSDGIPAISELVNELKQVKRHVKLCEYGTYKYVLSQNGNSQEMLIIAWD
ncbi:DNA adenine methylase [bacterium]|nr:DNA adenine methylase [bacterium]MBU1652342.1 DNA adenine methylase [bacterium]